MNFLLVYSLLAGLFSLLGGFLLLWNPRFTKQLMSPLLSFGAGAFLGAAFLDILPEALEQSPEAHPVLIAALTGFVLFFFLERAMMKFGLGHHHELHHSDHTESLPFLVILGDCIHNFLDGVVIALAFVANPVLALPTTLAISAHEIPQEIGDFAILLHAGWSRKKVAAINILQSLLTVPGVLLGYYMGQAVLPYLPLLLAGAAGSFLYIAASELIPEIHHQAGHKHFFRIAIPFLASIILIGYLTTLAHGQ